MDSIKIMCLFILVLVYSVDGFTQDFRNVSWGMSIAEVKNLETAPLTKEEKNWVGRRDGQNLYKGINLVYENVTVSGLYSDILYHFDNGLLTEVRVLFRNNTSNNSISRISTCIRRFSPLFQALKERSYGLEHPLLCGTHAYMGYDFDNKDNERLLKELPWGINDDVLNLIDKMVQENKYEAVFCRIVNERNQGYLQFETQYSDSYEYLLAHLELRPSFELEKKIRESDF